MKFSGRRWPSGDNAGVQTERHAGSIPEEHRKLSTVDSGGGNRYLTLLSDGEGKAASESRWAPSSGNTSPRFEKVMFLPLPYYNRISKAGETTNNPNLSVGMPRE